MTSIISLKPIDSDTNGGLANGHGDSPAMTTFSTPTQESNGSHVNTAVLPGILDDEMASSETSIDVVDLPQYVENKKADSGKGFHNEYKVG